MRDAERRYDVTLALKTAFTIHNIAYQGIFPRKSFQLTNLPDELMTIDGLEYYDQMCMMKAGIVFADLVTTVSPNYAKEIQTPEFGNGMDGVIATRLADLHGLINGIDTAVWNPAIDASLPARYSTSNLAGKALCRAALLKEFGWGEKLTSRDALIPPVEARRKLRGRIKHSKVRFSAWSVVSRPARASTSCSARGFFAKEDCRLVVLGGGERKYEEAMRALAAAHPGKVTVCVRLDEAMSHLVEAGSDFFLMPSAVRALWPEPDVQPGVRHGAARFARRRVGGHGGRHAGQGRGGHGHHVPADGGRFGAGLRRALALYADKARYLAVQKRAMERDFSWKTAVTAYEQLYLNAL
ncbi:MAG: glycogen/starch synthase [Lacunisphaera sp.]